MNLIFTAIVLSRTIAAKVLDLDYALMDFDKVRSLWAPSYYQSGMVLQREPHNAIIHGKSNPSDIIALETKRSGLFVVLETIADDHGKWILELPPQEAGVLANLVIRNIDTDEKIEFDNVLFGDVIFCSGQSNMQMGMSAIFDYEKEGKDSENYPFIRLLSADQVSSSVPLEDVKLNQQYVWTKPSLAAFNHSWAHSFSAVCYLSGRELARRDKSVPLGLISSSFGGTSDLQWSSPQALMKCGIFTSEDPKLSGLWNAMVVPFLKLKISAILWYQGESDCSNPAMYGCTFPQMILDWRNAFGNPKIPFGFVQLAAYDHHDADFSKIRLVQSVALGLENVFMITAVDLGDPDSMYHPIHPRNKQEVGRRLGRSLIRHLYNDSSIKKIAPSAKGAKISFDATSWTVKITFNSDSESIYLKGTAKCSACCSESPIEIYANSTWTRAQLEIQSSNSLILNGIGSLPSAVRGIWGPYPQCAFYNSENFAVPPFFFDLLH